MKKIIIISLIAGASLTNNNVFGMLPRTVIAHTKKSRPFYSTQQANLSPADMKTRLKLVQRRHEIKKRNDILMELITEQNKAIDELEGFSRPMSNFEHFVVYNRITACAQQTLELEQKMHNHLTKTE